MLPMIVTVNLAKGALSMSRKRYLKQAQLNSKLRRHGHSVHRQTGTLTQDKVILEKYVDATGEESDDVLKYAYLNSFYQTGLKNLPDGRFCDTSKRKASSNPR